MKHDTIANITAILLLFGAAAFLGGQLLKQPILFIGAIVLLVLSAILGVVNLANMSKAKKAQETAEAEEAQPAQEEITAP